MARRTEEQRDQLSPFLKGKQQAPTIAAAADASTDPSQSFSSSGQAQCPFNKRVLLLAGGACLGAVAAVCSLVLTGTPLHAITTNTAAAIGLSPVSRGGTTPVAADAATAAGGALDNEVVQAGDAFVPVPRLKHAEPQTDAGPAAAAADAPNNKPWGRRRLAGAVENDHDDDDMSEYDFEASDDDSGGICSPLEVVGLDNCPEMNSRGVVEKLLAAKADILRQVIKVLTDPASSGQGGNPDEPLLLVQKLAVDEADAVFGIQTKFFGHAADAVSWNPLPGGFNRWVEMYHRKVLRGTRPVLVSVLGNDVCALEKELSLEARMNAAGFHVEDTGDVAGQDPSGGSLAQTWNQTTNGGGLDDGRTKTGKLDLMLHFGQGEESFDVPVVLMTLGWDPSGDPTHHERLQGRDRSCSLRVLEMNRVVRWFTSHTRYDSHADEKFRYLPIGFGGFGTRNGLPHTAYIDAAKHQLDILETCPAGSAGSYDLLFECNLNERDPRKTIWNEMTEGKDLGSPIPVNRGPLEPAEMVTATARGIFGVSTPGTGADCFRHYEMMLEGNIALVPDEYSLRRFMVGLPAFFFGGPEEPWGSLTCGRLLEMAEVVQAKIKEGGQKEGGGGGLQFEKLTHGFWRQYIRREVMRAGGTQTCPGGIPGINSNDFVCCPLSCGSCAGVGCSSRPGGADACCGGGVKAAQGLCSETGEAPCVLEGHIDANATYAERSTIPMNPHGWTTFREVGCFSPEGHDGREQNDNYPHRRSMMPLHQGRLPFHQREAVAAQLSSDSHDRRLSAVGPAPVRLLDHDRTPEGCAAHCATKIGGGIGFFGIGFGDECWCDKVPGVLLPAEMCGIDCDGESGGGRCGGDNASAVFVYGPEARGAPFEYMGCFPSKPDFMFHAAVHLGKAGTPSMCEALCTSLRHPFFALENSELCRCGVIPANSPYSVKVPAFIEGGGYEPVAGPPNATLAAKPMPEGVQVGDPRFECHQGRCGGNPEMRGCGSERAYDLYRNTDPCVLYRDCQHRR